MEVGRERARERGGLKEGEGSEGYLNRTQPCGRGLIK